MSNTRLVKMTEAEAQQLALKLEGVALIHPAIPNSKIFLEKTSHGLPHLGLKPQAHSENPFQRVEPIADYVIFNLLKQVSAMSLGF
jgi:hypothetical protein